MIRSLRFRFFVVVWLLLVAGLVGLGTLLGRWGTIELKRVSAEARVDQLISDANRKLISAVLTAPATDSATLSAVLSSEVAADTMLNGVVISDRDGRILASATPTLRPNEFQVLPDGKFEFSRSDTNGGHLAIIRMKGNGQLVDPRDTVSPRWLIVLPSAQPHVRIEGASWKDDGTVLLSRTRLALLVGALVAGLVTLAVSGPLLGRVGALTRATARLREGDLAARVDVKGKDELADLGRSFNAMAEDLERSEAQRRQMVVDIAHELRTPLTNLTGMLEAVQDGLRQADADTLAALHDEAGLLGQLVGDLQDLALADAGELKVPVEEVDVAAAATRAAAAFDSRHGIVVQVPDGPVKALANERRLGQVLRNLIQNAVTHSPEAGSVVVALSPRAAALNAVKGQRGGGTFTDDSAPSVAPLPRGDGRMVEIQVRDHGPGIAPADLPRIWDRFYRTDASRSRATGGMGLGLPVARRLVEAMGGEITVESEVGKGSVFGVRLALA